jgi:hypothetical protein
MYKKLKEEYNGDEININLSGGSAQVQLRWDRVLRQNYRNK